MRKEILFFAVMAALLFAAALVGLHRGAGESSWGDTLSALFLSGKDADLEYFIYHLRLPRITAAVFTGMTLAVCGVILQNVLNNPLASSFTLGFSQGAAFGAAFSIIVLGAGSTQYNGSGVVLGNLGYVAAGAFAGSLTASAVILLFSFVRGMTPQGLILAGVAVSSFFSACTMLLQYFSTDSQLAAAVFWTFGDLGKGGWTEAFSMAGVCFIGVLFVLKYSWDYNAVAWGESYAAGLGVNVKRVRVLSLLVTAVMAAFATAFYGVIGFIGLIAPHMVRLVFRQAGHGFLIPASGILGGVLLLTADIAAQAVIYPVALPVGVITSFAGVPVFLGLLLRRSLKNA
ncbi:iron ABC transporter permease [Seleniivibrio sp.]|uniref:FecCD family ABC transporter permease n=1 Tax=Seleniivibrio sp. TaxID=2898801 RepID=UPI0025F36042|nr:iron ABC transporter permease [Seleniivibrio sp.]MCD8553476.1 iron ABC transporter permease [Seleniivibrio sp.]